MFISFELILLSILFFVLGLYMYLYNEFIYLDWNLISVSSINFSYQIYLDYYNMMFMSVILLISCMICLYSYWYIECYDYRFYYLMFGFIMSMLILVVSPNLMGMLLGWDGLGFVSFCLVLFYYNSDTSLDNSLITLYYNRLGDGFLIISIGSMLLSFGGCEMVIWDLSLLVYLLMLLGLSTKSAQFPFMSWLPKAMAAPTPVSSLVHSSTLVTAGVYMMFRFYNGIEGMLVYVYISLVTMFISGILALSDMDLKKIIAYSTLGQLGLMVFGLSVGMKDFVFFHMLSHAVFKSMMFMSGGVMIHNLGGWQDIRCYGSGFLCFPISSMCLLGGSFSLSGIYFLSGYYSKDILIEMVMTGSMNLFLMVLFYLCMVMTLLYSFRLLDFLNFKYITISYVGVEEGGMSLCMIILFLGSIIYGWVLSDVIFGFGKYEYSFSPIKIYVLLINFCILFYLYSSCSVMYMYLNIDVHKLLKNLGFINGYMYLDGYWVEMYGGFNIMSGVYKSIYWFKDYSIYFMFMLIFFIYLFI